MGINDGCRAARRYAYALVEPLDQARTEDYFRWRWDIEFGGSAWQWSADPAKGLTADLRFYLGGVLGTPALVPYARCA